jgi:tetratricopeptide (TPR) repeat protein
MTKHSKNLVYLALMAFGVISFTCTKAQDLKSAVKLTESEQFKTASEYYDALIKKEPLNGDNYFFYGENYFKAYFSDTANMELKETIDKSRALFDKGMSVDPGNPLNYIGLGRAALMTGNPSAAIINFEKAMSLMVPPKGVKVSPVPLEKQVVVYQRIAESYLKSVNPDTVNVFGPLRKAEKLDRKNPGTYILRGDGYLFLLNDGSNAIINYKRAQELDPNSPKAKLRLGQLWVRAKRYQDALGFYKEALQIDSTFTPAYRELAELYALAGQYENAQKNYKKFLELSKQNISAKVRYASFLFLTKNYKETIIQVVEIQAVDESYNFLNRLAGYSSYEITQYEPALKYMDKFFAKTTPEKIIQSDYDYYGKILAKLNMDSLALIKFRQALKMDSTNLDLLDNMCKSYNKLKLYGETAKLLQFKIRIGKATTQDYHNLGKTYYNIQAWGKADTAFAKVISLKPDFLPAYLWRARVFANMDPETKEGLAKPHYELLIEKARIDSVKNSKEIIEGYSYLAFYYLKNKKYKESIEYWEKVMEIDPTNEKAKDAIKDLKNRAPKK